MKIHSLIDWRRRRGRAVPGRRGLRADSSPLPAGPPAAPTGPRQPEPPSLALPLPELALAA